MFIFFSFIYVELYKRSINYMKRNIKIILANPNDLDAIHNILIERCKWFIDNNINQRKINKYPNRYNNDYFLKQMKENFLYVAKNKNEVVGVMLLKKLMNNIGIMITTHILYTILQQN